MDLNSRHRQQEAADRIAGQQRKAKASRTKVIKVGERIRPDGTTVNLVKTRPKPQHDVPTREPSIFPSWFSKGVQSAKDAEVLRPGHTYMLKKLYRNKIIRSEANLLAWIGHLTNKDNAFHIRRDPELYKLAAERGVLKTPADLEQLNGLRPKLVALRHENQRRLFDGAFFKGIITPSNYGEIDSRRVNWNTVLSDNKVRGIESDQVSATIAGLGDSIKTPEHLKDHIAGLYKQNTSRRNRASASAGRHSAGAARRTSSRPHK